MLKRTILGCVDRRQKHGQDGGGVASQLGGDVEAANVGMADVEVRPRRPPRASWDARGASRRSRGPPPPPSLVSPPPSHPLPQTDADPTRIGRVRLNVKNLMARHGIGTRRARTCLVVVPVIMVLVMLTRPIYAPLIDVFGPAEGDASAAVPKLGAAANAEGHARRLLSAERGAFFATGSEGGEEERYGANGAEETRRGRMLS